MELPVCGARAASIKRAIRAAHTQHGGEGVTACDPACRAYRVRYTADTGTANEVLMLAKHQDPASTRRISCQKSTVMSALLPGLMAFLRMIVSHRPGSPVQPGAVSAARPAYQAVWGGGGRRTRTHTKLDAQSANPHLGRLSLSGDALYH